MIILASHNPGKLREIKHALADFPGGITDAAAHPFPEPAETGLTFIENALIKARNACHHTHLPALADDSGLEVDALHGAPGVRSARYAGEQASDEQNVAALLHALQGVPEEKRTARFRCVMVLLRHEKDPSPIVAEGSWEGRILLAPEGTAGFGYDPIFFVPTHNCSAAALSLAVKNELSHRGQALRALAQKLRALQKNGV